MRCCKVEIGKIIFLIITNLATRYLELTIGGVTYQHQKNKLTTTLVPVINTITAQTGSYRQIHKSGVTVIFT